MLTDLGQTFPNEINKYRALRSNFYGSSNVSTLPLMNMLSTGQQNLLLQQQQGLMGNTNLAIQHQLNNSPAVVTSGSSCLNNLQQQSNTSNISSLLGCDSVSAGNNSNNIGNTQ